MNNERSWHDTKYIDKDNTCPQDTFYYCSNLYNPKMSIANIYTDYSDCVVKKTEEDCGQPFTPEGVYGGLNPYKEAQDQDYIDEYGEDEDGDVSTPDSLKMSANVYLIIAIVLVGTLLLSSDKKIK